MILVVAFERPAVSVERDDRVGKQVVTGPRIADPRPRIARAPIGLVQLRVVGSRDPDRRPAALPGFAGPGVVAELAGPGNRVRLPDLLARLGIERRDETADAALAARDTDHDQPVNGQRRHRDVVTTVVVLDAGFPGNLSGYGVECHEDRVERRHVDLVAVQRDAAIGRMPETNIGRHLAPVHPQHVAVARIDREQLVQRRRHEHDAVVDDRRCLMPLGDAGVHGPYRPQLVDIARVDLIERAIAPAVVSAAEHQPVAVFGRNQTLVGHRRVIRYPLRDGKAGQQPACAGNDQRKTPCGTSHGSPQNDSYQNPNGLLRPGC